MKRKIQPLNAGKFSSKSKINLNKTKVAGGSRGTVDSGAFVDVVDTDI